MNKDEVYAQFKREFVELQLSHPGVSLSLSAVQAWAVMSAIQLACRHPDWRGPTRAIAVEVAEMLQAAVARDGALQIMAAWGWCPDYDEPGD